MYKVVYDIIKLLHQNNGQLEFSAAIIRIGTHAEVIATFLAMLELVKQGIVSVTQNRDFEDIIIETNEINVPKYIN